MNNGDDAIKKNGNRKNEDAFVKEKIKEYQEGKISLNDYFVKLGEILRRVHSIKITRTAPIKATHPKGEYQWFKTVVKDLASKIDLSNEVVVRIQEFVWSVPHTLDTLSRLAPSYVVYGKACRQSLEG